MAEREVPGGIEPGVGPEGFRCGFVAIVGRPNVGKSTLVNRLLGRKISITSDKPQTTRHRLLGIRTGALAQAIYVDTPGIHLGAKRALNRYLNRAARGALADVDVVLLVVEPLRWTPEDDAALASAAGAGAPVVLVVNKTDRVRPRDRLLPILAEHSARGSFADIVPISARRGTNVETLAGLVDALLPLGVPLFPADQTTDRGEQFLAAELVREQLTQRLGEELPYRLTVELESFEVDARDMLQVAAVIWVERQSQKAIVIGRDGAQLKAVGTHARHAMEALFERRVFLRLWVKVRQGWSDDERALQSFGYLE